MINLVDLSSRVSAATKLAPDQLLIGDLWVALQEVQAALVAAQNLIATLTADPAALAALQAQVKDLVAQRDDALAKLGVAQLALTADQVTIAAIKAADDKTIAGLNLTIDGLRVTAASLQQQVNAAAQTHAVDLTTIGSLQQQLAVAQGQIGTLTGQLAKLQADLATAQSALTAANAEVVRLNAVVKTQQDQITLLQQQLAGLANRPPVWKIVPTITFTFGAPGFVDLNQYVSDPDADKMTFAANSILWPPGVTFDPILLRVVYDGVGALSSSPGHVITANDGRP
jgi:FtsZ-binding cell division protein ZapB